MIDFRDRVNSDELNHDIANGVEIALSEFELAAKVDLIMGGDDPELILEEVASDHLALQCILDIASIDCKRPVGRMANDDVRLLAEYAHNLNKRIEELVIEVPESKP